MSLFQPGSYSARCGRIGQQQQESINQSTIGYIDQMPLIFYTLRFLLLNLTVLLIPFDFIAQSPFKHNQSELPV